MVLSNLEAFVFDPLLEWKFKNDNEEIVELQIMNVINKKLTGSYETGRNLAAEGVVTKLINQASDQALLCQMYIGWAPFL